MRVEMKYQGDKQRMSEKNILEEIAEKTRERIRKEKLQFPLKQLKILAEKAPQQPSFLEALKKPGMSYICEVKKASPLQGADRIGISVSGNCERIRGSRCICDLLPHRAILFHGK